MFDMDRAVAEWKSEMSRGGVVAGADVEELESHLRESAERLMRAGLSAEEAFLVSVRRLGGTDSLRLEYGKERPERVWRERAAWMFAGLLAWQAIAGLSAMVSQAGVIAAVMAGARGSTLSWSAVVADVLALAAEFALAWMVYRQVTTGRVRRRPGVWVATGVSAIVVGRIVSEGGMVGLARSISPSDLGVAYLAHGYMAAALGLLLPIAFGVLAVRLHGNPAVVDC